MKEDICCKSCGNDLSSNNFEICDDCKKNHDLSVFLKNLMGFLGDEVVFDENDFEMMGIDEFRGYEYIWELSKLNLVNSYDGKFFINIDLINKFVGKHYLSKYDVSDKLHVTKMNGKYYEVYDPSKVKISDNPNSYRREIMNLAENINYVEESSNVPFPQSDDLNRFIFLGQHLLERDLSKKEIKRLNQVHDRIVNMYTSTGLYFKVFDKYKSDGEIFYRLNKKGKFIFQLDEYNLNIGICYCVLEHEIFNEIFFDCISKNEIKINNIVDIMLKYDLNLNSMVTIRRRANCVSSWMRWIFNLINGKDTKQIKLC